MERATNVSEPDDSVWRQIVKLKGGDEEAMRQLWERHFERLKEFARRRLTKNCLTDEEDVAASALEILFRGAAAGRFPNLHDRDDLWRLLMAIAQRKSLDEARRQGRHKRGGGRVTNESMFFASDDGELSAGLDGLAGDEPEAEYVAILEEEHHRLLGLLRDEVLRKVAVWKMQSYSNEDIAKRLGMTSRTVERKLQVIRDTWWFAAGGPLE
jgi:DNA-directed RNA polymerase specialized sigma24 family protein